jgi:hypothetical protein
MGRHIKTCTCVVCLKNHPARKKLPPNDTTKKSDFGKMSDKTIRKYGKDFSEEPEKVFTIKGMKEENEQEIKNPPMGENISADEEETNPIQEFLKKQKQFAESENKSPDIKVDEKNPPENPQGEIQIGNSQEAEREKEKKAKEEDRKLLISGYMLLVSIDAFYPDVLLWIINLISKGKLKHVKGEDISLSPEDIQNIEPVADEICRLYLQNLPPFTLFLVLLNASYISNIKTASRKNKPK